MFDIIFDNFTIKLKNFQLVTATQTCLSQLSITTTDEPTVRQTKCSPTIGPTVSLTYNYGLYMVI
jgi:hypothetical protein